MRESKFNFLFDHKGDNYVYNSFTGCFAKVDNEFLTLLENVRNNNQFYSESDTFNKMKLSGVIIDNDKDEYAEYRDLFEKTSLDSMSCTFTIALSFSCNFKCPYCYEEKDHYVMSDSHIEKLINFMEKSLVGKKHVNIVWYGGEPLIFKEKVFAIAKHMIQHCEDNGIKYSSSMVTNGFYVTKDIVEEMKNNRISHIQITLDGNREKHNQKRFQPNGDGSYDRILNAIKLVDNAGINLSVRVNVDKNNTEGLNELFDDLKDLNLNNTHIYFGLLAASTDACASIRGTCLTNEEFSMHQLKWNKALYEKGLFKSMLSRYPQRRNLSCAALMVNSFVVDSRGNFYKCWDDIGNVKKSVGNLDNVESLPFKKGEVADSYLNWSPFVYEECQTCKILPICSGFCAYYAMKRNKPQCVNWKYTLIDYLKGYLDLEKANNVK